DTLANVDVDGVPTPSARFMGGREYEQILSDALGTTPTFDDAAAAVMKGIAVRPSFVLGSGPFPNCQGKLVGSADSQEERAALASLYRALMTNVCLGLIDAGQPVLVEGRFSTDPVFLSALASLRRDVLAWSVGDGIALGAARLLWPDLPVPPARY